MNEKFPFPTPTDIEILEVFKQIAQEFIDCQRELFVSPNPYARMEWDGENVPEYVSDNSRNIFRVQLTGQFQPQYSHGSHPSISITFNQNDPEQSGLARLYTSAIELMGSSLDEKSIGIYGTVRFVITDFLNRKSIALASDPRLSSVIAELPSVGISAVQSAALELSNTAARLVNDSVVGLRDQRAALDAEYEGLRQSLELNFQKKQNELLAEAKALEELRKAVDDNGHMHARRALRLQLNDMLEKRTGSANSSVNMYRGRWKFIAFCSAGIAGLSLLTAVQLLQFDGYMQQAVRPLPASVYSDGVATDVDPASVIEAWQVGLLSLPGILLIKSALTGGAAVALLFYLLSWIKRTQGIDFEHESTLDKYRFDMERASWVLETVLEMKDKKIDQVPDVWLEAVTRGMFTSSGNRSSDGEFSEALAKLLGVSARAEFGINGARVEVGRAGLKELSRHVDGTQ